MNVILWIVAVALAVAFAAAGTMKLVKPKAELAEQGMGWVEDFSPTQIKLIGALELLAAAGLVVPPLLGIAPVLAPFAALGLVLVMAGAIATHARRKETPMIVVNLVLMALATVVVWGRFGPEQFSA